MKKFITALMGILLAVLLFASTCFAATLADGTYTPSSFEYQGGTGKVVIYCSNVTVSNGTAMADISFSSEYYDYVKVDGKKYETTVSEGNASVAIPVKVNGDTEIMADTTRMSEPHEIAYVLSIAIDAPETAVSYRGVVAGIIMALLAAGAGGYFFYHKKRRIGTVFFILGIVVALYAGYKGTGKEPAAAGVTVNPAAEPETEKATEEAAEKKSTAEPEVTQIKGLTYESAMEITYAKEFSVDYYEGGYSLIQIAEEGQFLVVPEGKEAPEGLDASITVLQQPIDHIYLVATSAMSLFDSLEALENIRLSGTNADGWYVQSAVTEMENGSILFAGKYSQPDYELLLEQRADLAIESTMILHSPEVSEKLEELGIPVLIDRSSYETEPLGRTEWMKLYSVLVDKEEVAQKKFAEQAQVVEQLADFENTGKTVAFFYLNSAGNVVVRKTDDYVPKMIEQAGGTYSFASLSDETELSSVNMTMEEFYHTAKDADYLIYNATIDAPLSTIDELLAKSELFADFKAVKNGNVWSTGKSMYQETDIIGEMIADIHTMLTDDGVTQLKFMKKLQ